MHAHVIRRATTLNVGHDFPSNQTLTAVDEPVSKALVAVVENVFATRLQTTITVSFAVAIVEAAPDLWCLQLIMIWQAVRTEVTFCTLRLTADRLQSNIKSGDHAKARTESRAFLKRARRDVVAAIALWPRIVCERYKPVRILGIVQLLPHRREPVESLDSISVDPHLWLLACNASWQLEASARPLSPTCPLCALRLSGQDSRTRCGTP